MIEALVITQQNRHLYQAEWDRYLRLRHDHFVEERGWREPSPDGREVDQFDTDSATYIIGIEDGEVVSSARLIPASEANMVSEVFPHLCDAKPVPRGDDHLDWTRSLVVRRKRSYGLKGTAGQTACAVMEYCIEEGVTFVGGIQPLHFLRRWQEIGWEVVPFGTPHQVGGEWCIVAYLKCTPDALANARIHCGVTHKLLVRRGLGMSPAFAVGHVACGSQGRTSRAVP
jgi:acyl-homoserine lactone synthase